MTNIFTDIKKMHDKFGVTEWVKTNADDKELMREFLNFRITKMMAEEWDELNVAYKDKNAEEIVDSIIDLIVFGVTILDAFGVDGEKAWNDVYLANMAKEPGVKEGRPNPFGLPDMIKDAKTWKAPYHGDNVGKINDAL